MNIKNVLASAFVVGAMFGGVLTNAAPEERPALKDYGRVQIDAGKCPQKICIFMDGTCNSPDSDTNVRRLFEIISAPRDASRLCYYDIGVGADFHKVTGAVGGFGLTKNFTEAYQFLAENYDSKDEIYIFGFSRGARQAQILCDLVDQCGIPDFTVGINGKGSSNRDIAESIVEKYKRHLRKESQRRKRGEVERLPKLINETGYRNARIKFVGLWDCVESLGSNVLRTKFSKDGLKKGDFVKHKFYRYDLPSCVDKAFHAMAIDEQRGLYEVVPWDLNSRLAEGQVLEQVWFVGCHGDVGGGYEETQGLAGISLNWMLEELEKEDLLPTEGFRVHQTFRAPFKNTNAITIGVVLSKFRNNYPRYDHFWKFPLAAQQRPKVHFSVVERLKIEELVSPDEKREPLKVYRPGILSAAEGVYDVPDTSTAKQYRNNKARSYYLDGDRNVTYDKWKRKYVDFESLGEDVEIVGMNYHVND